MKKIISLFLTLFVCAAVFAQGKNCLGKEDMDTTYTLNVGENPEAITVTDISGYRESDLGFINMTVTITTGIDNICVEYSCYGESSKKYFNPNMPLNFPVPICTNNDCSSEMKMDVALTKYSEDEGRLYFTATFKNWKGSYATFNGYLIKQPKDYYFTQDNKNKFAFTKVNLKMRKGCSTDDEVVSILKQGTEVKVVDIGSKVTLDFKNSNWVLVEATKNSVDREGKKIKKGTQGWVFGGYLNK